ncbi:major facilitator superfamily domain-containing protein [Aspergillus unguis]
MGTKIDDIPVSVHDDAPQKPHANPDLVDSEIAKYATETAIEVDEATSKRLKRMIDKRVLVVMMVTYMIQTLDKGALSFASVMGIREDTNLAGNEYQWLTTVVYLAILFIEFPENWIIQRVPTAKWLSLNVTLWGICIALIAAANNFTALVILRTFMGFFEAVCQPTFVVLSATWYKREEQSSVINIWYMMNGLQNIIGGLIAYGFSFVPKDSVISSWQSMFMTYGIITVIWGLFISFWMPDSPMRAKCWSEEDKRLMIERVRENQTGLQNKVFRKEQVWEAVMDPQLYAFAIISICTTIPSGGIGAYANIIIQSFGYSTRETQLLTMVVGAVTTIALIVSAYLDRKFKQTIYIMLGCLVPSVLCTAIQIGIPFTPERKVGLLIAYWTFYAFFALQSLALALMSRNVAGQTKKSVIIATNFVCWAAGNAIGPQVFRDKDAPRYYMAFSVLLACFVVILIVLVALRIWYATVNYKKEKKIRNGEAVADVGLAHAFEDVTDRENVNFRYIY